ncbi:MAG: sulfotransferase, partial [Acidimicrobiia bacterium]
FFDVPYAELVADPISTVRRVYECLGEALTADAAAAMSTYASANRQDKYGRHTYELADLGLERDELEERFADYRARYDIPREQVA